jgi:O-antigen/teichoic acid export membrane protein
VLVTTGYVVCAFCAYHFAELLAQLVLGSSAQAPLVRIAAITFLVAGATTVPLSYLRLAGHVRRYLAATTGKGLLQAGFSVVLLTAGGLGPKALLLGNLAASAIVLVPLGISFIRATRSRFAAVTAKALLVFGLPLVVTQVATAILTYGDRFLLQRTHGNAEVGVYVLAYGFGFLVAQMIYGPFSTVWDPIRFRLVRERGGLVTVARAFTYMNLVVLTGALLVVLLARPALELLTTTPYWGASAFVPPLVLAYVMQSWAGTLDLGLMLTERTKQVARANWTAALVILALYGLLIPTWGGMGAAIATLIAFSLRTWLVYRWSQQAKPIPYNWTQIRRLMSFALATFAIAALLPTAPWTTQVAERLALFACYLAATWFLVLSTDERSRALIFLRGLALSTRVAGA